MIKSITSVKVTGTRVILRAGFDVPIKDGQVIDDTRIRDVLPTLKYLIEQKAKIIIISHLGRPVGWDKDKSLAPVAAKLQELVRAKIIFLSKDITKSDCSNQSLTLAQGQILFLENLRFYPEDQANDEQFAKLLATFGDIYVDDAFSVAHHKEVSNYALAKLLPAYAGISFAKEISSLHKLLQNPKKPMVVLLGGAKIDDKVDALENLAKHSDHILVGGAVSNTFFKALGYEVGLSKVSNVSLAKQILRNYKHKIIMPIDVVVSENSSGKPVLKKPEQVRAKDDILDIGPETIRKFSTIIKGAKTMVWNGPFGLIENPKFATGSRAIAHIFASRCKGLAYGVVGGGETIEVVDQAKVSQFIDHISMGGGAMLEFLAGKELPGIKALEGK